MKFQVVEVKLAWTDNGNKMFEVHVRQEDENKGWMLRTWARDELDAYKCALERLEGAS